MNVWACSSIQRKQIMDVKKEFLSVTLEMTMILAMLISAPMTASAAVGQTFIVDSIEGASITYYVITE